MGGSDGENLPTIQETWVRSLGWEDALEKEMAPHSSILAWKIPWTKEPGRLQSMGSQRVGHDSATSLQGFPDSSVGKESACNAGDLGLIPRLGRSPGEGKGYPLDYSGLENSMDRGPWWATVHGVTRVRQDLATKPPPQMGNMDNQCPQYSF